MMGHTTRRITLVTTLLVAAYFANGCSTTYDYDPASAGDPEGSDRAPRAKTSSQFLRGVYADLLGRTPETYDFVVMAGSAQLKLPIDEEQQISGTLDGIGDSMPMRNLIVAGLLHSIELTIPDKAAVSDPRAYIRDQFTHLLGREPNVYELDTFASEWQSDPAVGPRTIIRAIVGSREYQSQ
jgi:hypothetical protein